MKSITHHLSHLAGNVLAPIHDSFDASSAGLPEAVASPIITLTSEQSFDLQAGPVRKQIGSAMVKLLAYNGSIPGPTLRVNQGSEATINFTNNLDVETTVHWHGLRLDNRFDGVPHSHRGTQPPIPPGGSFTYRLRFPDPGLYWYHPHVREDYTQEHGLYGNIIVVPNDPAYWPPVNRELPLVLDDILIEGDQVAPFSRSTSNRTVMGRFGNVMLANGETFYTLTADWGEVIRFYLTNTANVRVFNLHLPGAQMKLVGGDNGRVEQEQFVESILLAPSERAIVDVYFAQAGRFALEHRTPDQSYPLGIVEVGDRPVDSDYANPFLNLRQDEALTAERASLAFDLDRSPDKVLALVGEMGSHGDMGGHSGDGIEWEEKIALHNRISTPKMMHWKLVDRATAAANHDIDWSFRVGERVKIRLVNEVHADHPMQHPIHFHGQRFLVLARDGLPNDNLVWKDTALVRAGETVDILLAVANPGTWMAHCHIAEHVEGSMMLNFDVA
jgi:FtsP/CotA-like multicopper oxidase with cupredoxin domain